MESNESYIINNSGLKLYTKYWQPNEKPKALVFISHGYAEHCQYYEPLAHVLNTIQCFVFAHDHVGHGRSEGARVCIDTVDTYVKDVFQHTDILLQKYPNLPIFYIGHSMGGTIGIKAAMKRPNYFKGIVLSGPATCTKTKAASPFKVKLARILGWILPNLPIVPLDFTILTRNEDAMQARKNDPLMWHGYANAGWCSAMFNAIQSIENNISTVEWPFLLIHGDDDKICDISGSKVFYEMAPSLDKTFKIYPKAYHCLLEEPDDVKEQVTNDIIHWLNQRIN